MFGQFTVGFQFLFIDFVVAFCLKQNLIYRQHEVLTASEEIKQNGCVFTLFYQFVVVKKNVKKNIIFVANGWDTQLQYGHDFRLADFHFITEPLPVMKGDEPMPIQFKVRHVDHFMLGFISLDDEGYHIHSDAPIQGIAPGQFGCIYDADATICYGSGEIGIYKTN